MLRDLAELTRLDEGDPNSFRVRAYETAALGDLRAGERDRRAHGEGAPADRGDRQGHRGEDPRAARDGQGREARGAAPKAPAGRRRAAAHPGPRAEGARQAARRARRGVDRRPAPRARRAPRARPRGIRREVRGEARARDPAARRAGRGRPHADLGGAAARDADRRAPARGAGCIARVVLRVAAPVRGDGRRHRPRGDRERSGARDGGARLDELGRARARARRVEDERRLPARHAGRPARRGRAPARRRAALLHGLEGPQHQAAPARARARAHAQRVRAVRDRRRQASSRARPRSRSTPRSACRGSRPCCARTWARSTRPRTGSCPSRSAT